jgi:hypothetical protein
LSNSSTCQPAALQLKISKQVLRQLDGIPIGPLEAQQGKQNLGFSSRPFILCGLPIRRPPAGQLLFERCNRHFVLQVTGHPDYRLPFGQDRIVPIFLAMLAVQQQSQTIRFKSGVEMLDTFGMQKGGKEYRRLVAAFERIFGATIFFATDNQLCKARVVHMARFAFLREAQIWYNRNATEKTSWQYFENLIVLSEEFYKESDRPLSDEIENTCAGRWQTPFWTAERMAMNRTTLVAIGVLLYFCLRS